VNDFVEILLQNAENFQNLMQKISQMQASEMRFLQRIEGVTLKISEHRAATSPNQKVSA